MRTHRVLMLEWVKRSTLGDGALIETYSVEGYAPVCAEFACAAYDMKRCWNNFHASAAKGTLQADEDSVNVCRPLQQPRDDRTRFETVQWWVYWCASSRDRVGQDY